MTTASKSGSRTISTILFIVAAGLLAATVALGWLYVSRTSPDGYVTGQAATLSSGGYAIASTDIDLGALPDEWIPTNVLGTFRVEAESDEGTPIFIGVGPVEEVAAYLADVEYTEVTRFGSIGGGLED